MRAGEKSWLRNGKSGKNVVEVRKIGKVNLIHMRFKSCRIRKASNPQEFESVDTPNVDGYLNHLITWPVSSIY